MTPIQSLIDQQNPRRRFTEALLDDEFWAGAEEDGNLAANAPMRKVAICSNESGQVVIAGMDASDAFCIDLAPEEIDKAIALLTSHKQRAQRIAKRIDAEFATFNAIEKARDA